MQCLLIDQNAQERERLADMLASLGLDCETVSDELGELARQAQLVMLDASQPALAQEWIESLGRRRAPGMRPKIFCYAEAPAISDMAAFILAGATDVLVKPFDRDLLRFKLEQAGVLAH